MRAGLVEGWIGCRPGWLMAGLVECWLKLLVLVMKVSARWLVAGLVSMCDLSVCLGGGWS